MMPKWDGLTSKPLRLHASSECCRGLCIMFIQPATSSIANAWGFQAFECCECDFTKSEIMPNWDGLTSKPLRLRASSECCRGLWFMFIQPATSSIANAWGFQAFECCECDFTKSEMMPNWDGLTSKPLRLRASSECCRGLWFM